MSQVFTSTLVGELGGPQAPAAPNLAFVSSFTYLQDYYILGYRAILSGFSSLTGPVLPPTNLPYPVIGAIVMNTNIARYNLQVPAAGTTVSNVLVSLEGVSGYMPAAGGRPELIQVNDHGELMFEPDARIRMPANSPLSMYIGLANVSVWDGAGMAVTLYMMNA